MERAPQTDRRRTLEGAALGFIGVAIFSFTFPATKFALHGYSPWFIAFGRAVVAAACAIPTLWLRKARRPTRSEAIRLAVTAGGIVVGFPVLSALALQRTGSAHGAIVIALLPAATSVFAVVRAHERPGPVFWFAALAGVAIVTTFAVEQAGGGLSLADGYLLVAVAVCGMGYAEGAAIARTLGAIETISWALVVSLPVTIVVAAFTLPPTMPGSKATFGFLYSAIASMFLGFVAWYAGLAMGGVARVGQIQLFQALMTVGWSALTLGEHVSWTILLAAIGVIASVAVSQRARVGHAKPRRP